MFWYDLADFFEIQNVEGVLHQNKGIFATIFWLAGILVGFASGPNQSSSRSLMARFSPKNKQNEFFGFFAFSGKITAFLGPFLLAQVTYIYLKYSNFYTVSNQISYNIKNSNSMRNYTRKIKFDQ